MRALYGWLTRLAVVILWTAPACKEQQPAPAPSGSAVPSTLTTSSAAAPPRKGMAWIPPGALVAGTPPERFPRIASQEMRGEQVILSGFYIDLFSYPNEEGAIPVTNVTQEAARTLCSDVGKRLCTELEWERACKGPGNTVYEYADKYDPARCQTGQDSRMRPSGLLHGCRSRFGPRDLHGGVWEWTDSAWGRGSKGDYATVRGGNAREGELVARCANARKERPKAKRGTLGFRCCAGPRNTAEVSLRVEAGAKLEYRETPDKATARKLAAALPARAKADLGDHGEFRINRLWIWRPIGNERLLIGGGCAGLAKKPACGVVLARQRGGRVRVAGWAFSGYWAPTLHSDTDAKSLWLFGGDDLGSFRQRIAYNWGALKIGARERNVPRPRKRRR